LRRDYNERCAGMKYRVPIEILITHDFGDIGNEGVITSVNQDNVSYTWCGYICKTCGIFAIADNAEYINSMPIYTCAEYLMKEVLE
jgi:hypothetical protein